jgi:hypothetical protein
LDERRRPTRLAGAPASQGSCRSLGRRGLEASHRGFQIPPICRRHYCGALAAPSLSPQAYARSGASPRLYTLLRTFSERKNYAGVRGEFCTHQMLPVGIALTTDDYATTTPKRCSISTYKSTSYRTRTVTGVKRTLTGAVAAIRREASVV